MIERLCPLLASGRHHLAQVGFDGKIEAGYHQSGLNSLSLQTEIGYDVWKPQGLVVSCVLGSPSYPSNFQQERRSLPGSGTGRLSTYMRLSSPSHTLEPNAVLRGNSDHASNQLLLTKEYEEKVGIKLLWGRVWKKEGDKRRMGQCTMTHY